ncbi:heme-binding domain-containing protein [Galbibacter mesophilus]|uniref:heme-binding domain-containing protein n=1 Tax=Galbibacter mesophilus TaxID=379069 RepID=UPI00191FCBF2|nr:heme-binding domain-containing protein [Galbibacter mesophilus]MCM5662243.1 heme-binding domain-containing protein [Galbibacter mesophilus]
MTSRTAVSLFILLILFLGLQLFRYTKNTSEEINNTADFLYSTSAPKEISDLFLNACYDCHSNNTHYKWYDEVVPINWYITQNINQGKFVLNFSEWESLSVLDREVALRAMLFDIQTEKMPKKMYATLHKEARLSEADKKRLVAWVDKIHKQLVENHDH